MKLTKKYTLDSMSISATFVTGGSIKFSVGRGGEKTEVAGSNNGLELIEQNRVVNKYLEVRDGENNGDRFERFENLLTAQGGCKSVKGVVNRMQYEMSVLVAMKCGV